ncbi:MAG: tetratricopeptide repeat protein [Dehalococcoidia bacterium]|nr:tetratricopeptide repeat protein [Dehalococcoidia bacterium]
MAAASRTAATPALRWAGRIAGALEATWLLTAALVPLIFVPTDFMSSEAVNAYVEVPKTTALRLLAGVMVILWIVEWLLRGGLTRPPQASRSLVRLQAWLVEQPSRWIVVAATIYIVAAIISTALSQSFFISLWGEVSGQFGYSLYTTLSYFVLFAVIVTHLKTRQQLHRLLTVLVTAGFLVAVYGIVQRYEGDLLNVGEAGSFRVASTMANPVFTGAALVGTGLLSLGLARALLEAWGTTPGRAAAVVLLTLVVGTGHLLAVWFTDARGSWLIGVPAGLVTLLGLPAVFDALDGVLGKRALRADLVLLTCFIIVLTAAVLAAQVEVIGIEDFAGVSMVRVLAFLVGIAAFLSILVAMFPARLSEGVRDFAKTLLLVGSALLVALLVVTYTYSPVGTVKLAFRDLAFLDARVLLAVFGAVGLLGLLALAVREPRALLDARDRWREDLPQTPRASVRLPSDGRVRLITVGRNAGAALIGAVGPLLAAWDGSRREVAKAARVALVLSSMVVIALLVGGLVATVSSGAQPPAPGVAEREATDTVATVTPAEPEGRGLSFRNDIWAASWRLIRDRPWFEYEELSYALARPLVGYGPELFKYTFPLESPKGGLLSQAHNFFVHHFVEQGILGGFASMGLVLSFFAVGAAQLWRSRERVSTGHRWILIALMATIAGRVAEMMVGVAREPDLVTFWVLLAILVVLPSVMGRSQGAAVGGGRCPTCGEEHEPRATSCLRCGGPLGSPAAGEVQRGARRRERRARQRDRRARGAVRLGAAISPTRALVLGVMSVVIVFVGWLSWDKNVDYAWAAAIAGSAGEKLSQGDLRAGHRLMSQAVSKAPDVPVYYHNLSRVYDGYRKFVTENQGEFQSCEEYFALEPREGRYQVADGSFAGCAEESYIIAWRGLLKNGDAAQNKLVLANSAMVLALLDYEGLDDEAIRYYEELTDMLPKSWRQEYLLRRSQVRLGKYQDAVDGFEETMAKAGVSKERAQSLYVLGLAHDGLDQREEAIDAFEKSLDQPDTGGIEAEVLRHLFAAYEARVEAQLDARAEEEALATLDRYLARTEGSTADARPLYLKGVAYHRLQDLDRALEVLRESLQADGSGAIAADVHGLMATVYADLGDADAAAEHSRLSRELEQG